MDTRYSTTAKSSGQELLLKDRSPSSRNHQIILVEVNSRDRSYLQQTTSNPLTFSFQRPLKDVRSVELISGTIPAYPYNINKYNNKFTFYESTAAWTVVLAPGNYSTDTLLIEMGLAINGLPGLVNTYSFTQDIKTFYFVMQRLTGTLPFSFHFSNFLKTNITDSIDRTTGALESMNTPAALLGFDSSDYSDQSGILISPYPMDIDTATTRLYMYINAENSLNLGCIERGSGRRSPFGIIYLDTEKNGYKYLNKETISPISYSLPQPISRLNKLIIEFRDEFYRLIDFNGKEFALLFQFTVLE